MKRVIYWRLMTLIVFLLPFLGACGNDNDDEHNAPDNTSQDSYYVKYEVENGKQVTYASKTTREITYLDTGGKCSVTVENKAWNGTYGPFKKGDKVYMSFSSYGKYSTIARLSVSKNREAFTIKDERRDVTGGSLEYTIDY